MTNLQLHLRRLADRIFLRVGELFGDLAEATAEPVNAAVAFELRSNTPGGHHHTVTYTPGVSIAVRTVHARDVSGLTTTIDRVYFGTDIVVEGPINATMIDPTSLQLPALARGRRIWAGVPITVEWTGSADAKTNLVFTGARQQLRGRPG